MKRALTLFALFAMLAPGFCAAGSTKMWGCAQPGQRRNVLVLVDRGAQSYVKFSGQRITAQLSIEDDGQRWTWGANSVLLTTELVGEYYEAGALKVRFKCKRLGGD